MLASCQYSAALLEHLHALQQSICSTNSLHIVWTSASHTEPHVLQQTSPLHAALPASAARHQQLVAQEDSNKVFETTV